YRVKTALLAILGYLVIFGMLGVLLMISLLCVWAALSGHAWWLVLVKAKLILVLPALGFVILRSLWVRIKAPTGYRVQKAQCPRLFDEVAHLSSRLRTPRIHRILIVNDFNAAIAQVPRLGIFGWQRNYLILGLPLLLELSTEQARAVLAHELGHLSGNHSRFGAWIYRVRLSWCHILAAFNQMKHGSWQFPARFFDWYAPYFSAYSFALARANEYEADAVAASLTSSRGMASALVAVAALPAVDHERYWEPLSKRVGTEPVAPRTPVSDFARHLRNRALDTSGCQELLNKIMAKATNHSDTHPSLRDRLAALGAQAELSLPSGASAADEWIGSMTGPILAEFDRQWLQDNEGTWTEQFAHREKMKLRLLELEQKDPAQQTREERWEAILLNEYLRPDVDALPSYEHYKADYPTDSAADLSIGRLLLRRHDETGLQYLEKATEQFQLAGAACENALWYAENTNDLPLADKWKRRAEQQFDLEIMNRQEQTILSPQDRLKRTTLSHEALARIRQQLQLVPEVESIWICEKDIKILPNHPVYVLSAQPRRLLSDSKRKAVLDQLTSGVQYPGNVFVILTSGNSNMISETVRALGVKLF
ncbi:MAG: hypothetical protein ABS70_07750, partial [Nitrospira sp. SCN 59-13]